MVLVIHIFAWETGSPLVWCELRNKVHRGRFDFSPFRSNLRRDLDRKMGNLVSNDASSHRAIKAISFQLALPSVEFIIVIMQSAVGRNVRHSFLFYSQLFTRNNANPAAFVCHLKWHWNETTTPPKQQFNNNWCEIHISYFFFVFFLGLRRFGEWSSEAREKNASKIYRSMQFACNCYCYLANTNLKSDCLANQ